MERRKDFAIKAFMGGNDDADKASWFEMSKNPWISIEEEVREWVEANWSRWEEEKTKWLDDGMRTRIKVAWIPSKVEKEKEKERRASMIRPTVIQAVMGAKAKIGPAEEHELR